MSVSAGHQAVRAEFREFTDRVVAPYAEDFHRDQHTPDAVIKALADRGYLGLPIPEEFGGGGGDAVTVGLLATELGRACSSVRSLFTVHTMVAHAIARWGSGAQRQRWLPLLATGERIGAFALSEPEVGSDAAGVTTRAVPDGRGWLLRGRKKWITYGQIADVFLVIGRTEQGPTAFLVERDTEGLTTEPITELMGIRASMTAEVRLDGCTVADENLLGRPGLGVSHIAGAALDLGRYTVAWGCLGIIDACLTASVGYAGGREQFGAPLKEHQLVRQMISRMFTDHRAAELLCLDAARLRDQRAPDALAATSLAKYFASTAAVRCASDAVQIHGANGCAAGHPVRRHYGDAKVMEIIEGSSQIHEINLAEYAFQEFSPGRHRPAPAAERSGI
ncbi:acyl-CoA dehydrogenase family protein [Streptomyces sp. FXJ1.4098]|uniref:acyl-CoA dehydrogenase family protein n=1 Tax=Streptomyces sp. NPDC020845 TaxID=3365096 RepID=UPI002990B0B4|nr:acyl-CoA dehydrogenase family protein [Streptomyces sp. FXJ1.4098]